MSSAELTQDPSQAARYRLLLVGDPAPWFTQASTTMPNFRFQASAGRYVVMCFFMSAGQEIGRRALSITKSRRRLFDDEHIAFFGVSIDPEDRTRVSQDLPGVRFLWDFDRAVSSLYGATPDGRVTGVISARPMWIVLDPTMRIIANIPFHPDGSDIAEVTSLLLALPPVSKFAGVELQAPILYLPNVFESDLCDELIGLYEAHGGEPSGFMNEVDGKTVRASNPDQKRRWDYLIEDEAVIKRTQDRIVRRVIPEIRKVHQFQVTRMERYIVACYSAEDGGHFAAHRDNGFKGTAHRRFAVSLNLNDDYEGGELGFPEYGPRTFKPPKGAALVFSCSLLHAASRVTRGRRYVFLPFLYDEESARLREANNDFLGEDVGEYRMAD